MSKKEFPPAPQQTSSGHELDPMITNTGRKPLPSAVGDSALFDDVERPKHYTQGEVEFIEAVEARGFGKEWCICNILKYAWRAGEKGSGSVDEIKDVQKILWYARRRLRQLELEVIEKRNEAHQNFRKG